MKTKIVITLVPYKMSIVKFIYGITHILALAAVSNTLSHQMVWMGAEMWQWRHAWQMQLNVDSTEAFLTNWIRICFNKLNMGTPIRIELMYFGFWLFASCQIPSRYMKFDKRIHIWIWNRWARLVFYSVSRHTHTHQTETSKSKGFCYVIYIY